MVFICDIESGCTRLCVVELYWETGRVNFDLALTGQVVSKESNGKIYIQVPTVSLLVVAASEY